MAKKQLEGIGCRRCGIMIDPEKLYCSDCKRIFEAYKIVKKLHKRTIKLGVLENWCSVSRDLRKVAKFLGFTLD